jgi:hypothetical protein
MVLDMHDFLVLGVRSVHRHKMGGIVFILRITAHGNETTHFFSCQDILFLGVHLSGTAFGNSRIDNVVIFRVRRLRLGSELL